MSAWIGLIGTIAGAIVAGSLMLLKERANRIEDRRKEQRKLLLDKLEEIYVKLGAIQSALALLSVDMLGTINNEERVSLEEYIEKLRIEKVLMKVQFYCPDISKQTDEIEENIRKFLQIVWNLSTDPGLSLDEQLAACNSAQDLVSVNRDVVKAAQKRITKRVRSLVEQ